MDVVLCSLFVSTGKNNLDILICSLVLDLGSA